MELCRYFAQMATYGLIAEIVDFAAKLHFFSFRSGIQDLAAPARYSSAVDVRPKGNARSDVPAKAAFCQWLIEHGYSDAQVVSSPADVIAHKDLHRWLFEVKYTAAQDTCFGAATLTEWTAAAEDPEHFRFVIAYQREGSWCFDQYAPEEFMAFSSVPPFKIYFSVPLDGRTGRERAKRSKKIHLTKTRLRRMGEQFEELRTLEE